MFENISVTYPLQFRKCMMMIMIDDKVPLTKNFEKQSSFSSTVYQIVKTLYFGF